MHVAIQSLKILFCGGFLIKLIFYTIVSGTTYIIYFGVTYNSGKIG